MHPKVCVYIIVLYTTLYNRNITHLFSIFKPANSGPNRYTFFVRLFTDILLRSIAFGFDSTNITKNYYSIFTVSLNQKPAMIKIAQIQFDPRVGELERNIKKVEILLSRTEDAQLVILPELANSGYNFLNRQHALSLASTVEESSYLNMLIETAAKYGQYIVSGFHEREGDKLFNTSLLISSKGVIGKYRKIHLFMNEKQIFEKGNLGLPVFELEGYRLGMLICFDYLFPEIWRIMALKGVDIIAHPSNLVTYKAFKVVPAQAVINRFFIFTTNRIGTERDISFSGRSFAVDPEGEVIAEASEDKEEILFSAIDPSHARNKMITLKNHVLDDRFPEDYREII